MGEVFSIGIDISALIKASKLSDTIKEKLNLKDSFKGFHKAFNKESKVIGKGFTKDIQEEIKKLSDNKNGLIKGFDTISKRMEELKGKSDIADNFNKLKETFDELKSSDIYKKFDKAFDEFNKDTEKNNRLLKEQNKNLKNSVKELKIMRLISSKLKTGILGAAGFIGAGITSGVMGGIKSYDGALGLNTRAKNVDLVADQASALGFAGKMTGIGEDTLISTIEGLHTSINDITKWHNFASLGMKGADLQKKNPVNALFEVFDKMKENKLPTHRLKEIIDDIGIPFEQFKFVLKEGTGELRKYYKEGTEIHKAMIDENGKKISVNTRLMQGERELIRLGEKWRRFMKEVGYRIAPVFVKLLKRATPMIEKFADALGTGLDFLMKGLENFLNAKDKKAFIKEKIAGWVNSAWEFMSPVFTAIKDKAVESLKDMWDKALEFVKDKWYNVMDFFQDKFLEMSLRIQIPVHNLLNSLKPQNQIKNVDEHIANELNKDRERRQEERRKREEFKEQFKKVNDVVITKKGDIIETSPQDYLFATKRPQDLVTANAGASAGGTYTYNININANVRNDNDIQKLKKELERLIRSFDSKR